MMQLTKSDLEEAVKQVLIVEISPLLKMHGGDCTFLEIDEENIVHIKFAEEVEVEVILMKSIQILDGIIMEVEEVEVVY
jgi:hypothetical protein